MTTLARRLRARERKRRQARLIKKILLVCILCGFALAGSIGFLFSKRFEVSVVSINGAERIATDDLRAYVDEWLSQKRFGFLPERAYWVLDTDALTLGLKASFAQIREVAVTKDFPTGLEIAINEYDGWGVLCRGNPEECFWIDHSGIAFERAPGFSGLIVPKVRDERMREIKLGERVLSNALMRITNYFNDRAVSDADLQSVDFLLDAKDEVVRIKTRAGWDILLLEKTDPERAYKNLRTAVDSDIKGRTKELLYIDLRYGNRIFYKFK